MAEVEISNPSAVMGEIVLGSEIVIDSPVDTVGEVEVVDSSRKTRTRRKATKKIVDLDGEDDIEDEDEKPILKRRSRKRNTKTSGSFVNAKRKFTGRNRYSSDDNNYGKQKAKDRGKDRGRRKRDTNNKRQKEKKTRERRPKKALNRGQNSDDLLVIDHSSGEDSVVFCEVVRPPMSSYKQSASYASPPVVSSRLEDSSSNDSSSSSDSDGEGSSSSSSSSSVSVISNGSLRVRTPTPPPLVMPDPRLTAGMNWLPNSVSGSSNEDSDSDYMNNGSSTADNGGSPPRSPSSASSESADKSFQCHICKKWFSSNVTLRTHRRSHQAKPNSGSSGRNYRRYECDCCDATFTRRERLEQHRSEKHRGTFTERCEVCNRGFEDEEQQRRHSASHTQDERAGRCSECGEIFTSWDQLRRHRASHAPPAPHACPLCRKAFTYQHSLSKHLLNHSKAVYKCVVCKTSFDDADSLAKHLNSHLDRYKQTMKP